MQAEQSQSPGHKDNSSALDSPEMSILEKEHQRLLQEEIQVSWGKRLKIPKAQELRTRVCGQVLVLITSNFFFS